MNNRRKQRAAYALIFGYLCIAAYAGHNAKHAPQLRDGELVILGVISGIAWAYSAIQSMESHSLAQAGQPAAQTKLVTANFSNFAAAIATAMLAVLQYTSIPT